MPDILLGSKCVALSPGEADRIFFPGPGKKVNTARNYCGDCPVLALCLNKAIREGLTGFWAGTTDKERNGLIDFFKEFVDIESYLPKKKVKFKGRRKKPEVFKDPYYYLDVIEPTDRELAELA